MNKPYLSICIPTYNRAEYLKKTIESIIISPAFFKTGVIEIVISDNASSDHTSEVILPFKEQFPEKIKYIRLKKSVDSHFNFENALKNGNGVYLKLLNDTSLFQDHALEMFIHDLKQQPEASVFLSFITRRHPESGRMISNCNDLLAYASFYMTWISAFCFKRSAFLSIEEPFRFYYLSFPHVDLAFRLLEKKEKVYVSNKEYYNRQNILYHERNEADIYGNQYLILLKKYNEKKLLSDSIFQKEMKEVLFWHIIPIYFDFFHEYNEKRSLGFQLYWKSLRLYHRKLYFYISLIIAFSYSVMVRVPFMVHFALMAKNFVKQRTFHKTYAEGK